MWCVSLFAASLLLTANASTKCYDNVGCFSNAWPFWNTFGILPHSPEENGITFHLYTRINPTNDQVLDPNGSGTSVMSTNFNDAHKTVFIIHGFNGKKEDNWIKLMKSALIQYFDVNVIVVVWAEGAKDNYIRAVANTRVVGAVTANMIKLLQRSSSLTLDNVHLVGHSLGAHVAGYVGEIIPEIGRITEQILLYVDFDALNVYDLVITERNRDNPIFEQVSNHSSENLENAYEMIDERNMVTDNPLIENDQTSDHTSESSSHVGTGPLPNDGYLNPYQPMVEVVENHEYSRTHATGDTDSSESNGENKSSQYLNPYQPMVSDSDRHEYCKAQQDFPDSEKDKIVVTTGQNSDAYTDAHSFRPTHAFELKGNENECMDLKLQCSTDICTRNLNFPGEMLH
ncbi:pancreatic lipase-related protein 1 [Mytilus galloprovincialis]|uniref:Pancreatic lipase-related protein 1 n=1 Tax=Mytilus galloprovincialis TaxID=29158 RepID=A0A8B6FVX4_MYTGA|nr:pancreatic lipase-related protein 1 [Mytilus galloprovincialis]